MLHQTHQLAVALANALDPLYWPFTILLLVKVARILVKDATRN